MTDDTPHTTLTGSMTMKTTHALILTTLFAAGTFFNGCVLDPAGKEGGEEFTTVQKAATLNTEYIGGDGAATWTYAASNQNGSGRYLWTRRFTTGISGSEQYGGLSYPVLSAGDEGFRTVLYSNFSIRPGTTWEIFREGDTTITGVFDGYNTEKIAIGTFEDVARFTITTMTSDKYEENGKVKLREVREDMVVWYAPNVGLIKEVVVRMENRTITGFTTAELVDYSTAG